MTQYVINIGTLPNDGTGDPLRTAFNDVNLNFNQVWATGLVGSNITIANNTILTSNTNGNLILNPNGIGVVQANAHIVPDSSRIRNLGSANTRWNYMYGQYLDVVNANISNAAIGNTSTINIAVANLHVSGGSNGYVLQTDGTGNLTWTAQTGGGGNGVPGGANTQVQFNNAGAFGGAAGFTFNNTSNALAVSGNVTANNINTSGIISASGNVRGANFNTVGVVSATGNIQSANLLVGGGTKGVISWNTDIIGLTSDYVDDLTSVYLVKNDSAELNANTFVLIRSDAGNSNYQWEFGVDGNLTVPVGIRGSGATLLDMASTANSVYLTTTGDDSTGLYMTANFAQLYSREYVSISSNTANSGTLTWTFEQNGNLTLPGNTSSINYANGQPYGGSGSANIGNLDIVGTTISIADGAPETYINLSSTVEGWAYVQVPTDATANVYNTRIHNDAGNIEFGTGNYSTGNTNYTWTLNNSGNLTFPDNSGSDWPVNQQRFGMGNIGAWLDGHWTIGEFSGNAVSGEFGIRIDPSIEGPVGMTFPASASSNTQPVQIYSTNGGGISLTTGGPEWTFDSTGNLTAPGNVIGVNLLANTSLVSPQLAINLTNYNWSDPIVGITLGANTLVQLDNNVFGDPYSGQVTIEGVVGTTQANGNWWYRATDGAEFELFQDAEGTPVDSTSWTAYTSGGLAFTQGYANIEINAQNITIRSDHGDYNNKSWSFNRDGTTVFPTLSVDLHNGGVQTGQVLQMGDPSQQAIITGPTPAVNNNAQRLIIQGQRGLGTGEGGDVYLWAGDAENNGGDIKIYAGDADAGNVGDLGGYVNIDGGAGYTRGGQVEITGGYSSSGDGGYVNLVGGGGSTHGGNVGIQAGYGQSGPGGAVTIQGGASNNGVTEYGNVGISAGASSWAFDNTGNLTLPNTGVIYETNIPFGGLSGKTIALKPYGGTNADQQLLVYPTAGADANHLHLTSGNLYNTELFLGNDDLYVKLANTGNIVINSNDGVGNSAQWTFDTQGTIVSSGNLTLQTPSGVPASLSNWNGGGGWNQGAYIDLATTGGTGTGLTVNVAAGGGGYISINQISINTPGTGYTNGDVITINNENDIPGTFVVTVAPNNWTLNTAGILTVPGNINTNGHQVVGASGNLDLNIDGSIQLTAGSGVDLVLTASGHDWTFDNGGDLTVPGNSTIGTRIATGGAGGNSVTIRAGSSDTFASAPGGNLNLIGGFGSFGDGGGPPGGDVNIQSGFSEDSHPGNVNVNTGGGYIWTHDYTGKLALATSNSESAAFIGSRKLIGGLSLSSPYSVTMAPGGTPTVAYTALSGTQSVKVTFVIESSGSGFQWEQFDVIAVPSQDISGAVNFVVSNRVKGAASIPDTVVTATMSGSQIQISLTLDAAQNSGGTASFDAVEFGLMVD